MIVGAVNASREAVIRVSVRDPTGIERELDAAIDTGFNDELTLPASLIKGLALSYAAPTRATIAGGQVVEVDYFLATIVWNGSARQVFVVELDGMPLVGMGLLDGHRMTLDAVPGGRVTIEELSA